MNCSKDEKSKRMTMLDHTHHGTLIVPLNKIPCQRQCEKCKNEKEVKDFTPSKKIGILALLFVTSILSAAAQDTNGPAKTFWDDPFNSPMLPLYVVSTFVLITILLVMLVSLYLVKILNLMVKQSQQERAKRLGVKFVPQPTWWDKITQQLNNSVPLEKEKDIDLGHNFDGIRELDNHLPPWWKWLFYATIVWAVVYLAAYHLTSSLPLSIGEYENEITLAEDQAKALQASQPQAVIDENTLVYTKDEGILSKGKVIFNGNCVACHRNDGGGNTIGPNLTDQYWIHGGGIKNVFTTIKNGVVEKGMPAWGKAMSPQDVRDVAFYVMSLQGSNPKDGKAPQGELAIPEEELIVAKDSLIVKN